MVKISYSRAISSFSLRSETGFCRQGETQILDEPGSGWEGVGGGASPPVSIATYVNSELCLGNTKALCGFLLVPPEQRLLRILQMAAVAGPPQTSSPTRPLRSPALESLHAFMWSD